MAQVDVLTNAEIDEVLDRFDQTQPKLQRRIVAELVIRCDKLQAFKDWVHAWLDSHGVPKEFPDGSHTKEGCRIGDRMDWLWDQIPFEQSKT